MASRSQFPKWSADGKYVAYVSDRSGRDEIWISDPEGKSPKKISDLDNEKGALVLGARFEDAALHRRGQEAVRLQRRRRQDRHRHLERREPHRLRVGLARQQVGRVREAGSDAALARLHRPDRRRRGAAHLRRSAALLRVERGVDGRRSLSRVHVGEGASNGIATQGGINTTMELWVLSLRDRDRDPMNRDIDNEAQGLAAEARGAAERGARRGGGTRAGPTCASTGTASRARARG
jgi:hypothetical protein